MNETAKSTKGILSRPAKSREQRRLSTAIALGINVRTYGNSAHCTLDNRRSCVLCDRSSGLEHLDTVSAVL